MNNDKDKQRRDERQEEEEVKGAVSSDSNLGGGVRLNVKFQEYLPGLEIAEDVMNI